MASGTYFVRGCPTCGRNLEIRVELLGRQVECVHCGADFNAREQASTHVDDKRVEQALARAQAYIDSIDTRTTNHVPLTDPTATEGC